MKFRKRPIEIEAIQVPNGMWSRLSPKEAADWVRSIPTENNDFIRAIDIEKDGRISIKTIEGIMTASPGDWIIKGMAGEFYPCKPHIFDATYELVTD